MSEMNAIVETGIADKDLRVRPFFRCLAGMIAVLSFVVVVGMGGIILLGTGPKLDQLTCMILGGSAISAVLFGVAAIYGRVPKMMYAVACRLGMLSINKFD